MVYLWLLYTYPCLSIEMSSKYFIDIYRFVYIIFDKILGFSEIIKVYLLSGDPKDDSVDGHLSRTKFLRRFKIIWPDHVKERDIAKLKDYGSSVAPLAILCTIKLDDGWLSDPPLEEGEVNGAGVWVDATHKFPAGLAHMVPTYNRLELKGIPNPTPLIFPTMELEDLFAWTRNSAGPEFKMVHDGKVSLDPKVFDVSSTTVDKKFNFGTMDSICRDSLRETLVAEQFADLLQAKCSSIRENWATVSADVAQLRSAFDETKETLSLISTCLGRSRQMQIGLLVSNKLACRQHVMERCDGNSLTKEAMLGSSFASPSLFGPVPMSLKKRLETSSSQAVDSYKLKIIPTNHNTTNVNSSASSSKKRQAQRNFQNVTKRPRNQLPFPAPSARFRNQRSYQDFLPDRGSQGQSHKNRKRRGKGRGGRRF